MKLESQWNWGLNQTFTETQSKQTKIHTLHSLKQAQNAVLQFVSFSEIDGFLNGNFRNPSHSIDNLLVLWRIMWPKSNRNSWKSGGPTTVRFVFCCAPLRQLLYVIEYVIFEWSFILNWPFLRNFQHSKTYFTSIFSTVDVIWSSEYQNKSYLDKVSSLIYHF